MALTPTQIYGYLNTAYTRLGFGAGNDPVTIDDSNIATIGALPASQLQTLFDEFNILLTERWFTNAINESAKGIARFIFRRNGEHGFSIVDRFANLLTGASYPVTDSGIAENLVSRASDPVDVKRFTEPYAPGQFKTTIDFQAFRKFLTPGGMSTYVAMLESNLYQSAEYAGLLEIVDMLESSVDNETVVVETGYTMNTEKGLRALCEDIMTACDGFRQPTALYNKGSRVMSTPDSADVVIVTTPSRWNRLKTHLFSDAKNLDQLYADGRVIFAPEGSDFGSKTVDGTEYPCQFIVCDARAYAIEITTLEIRPFEVANMNYRNLFMHVEGVKGQTPFANCVAFCGDYGTFRDGVTVPHVFFGEALDGDTLTVGVEIDGEEITPKTESTYPTGSFSVGPGGGVISYDVDGNTQWNVTNGVGTKLNTGRSISDSLKISISANGLVRTENVCYAYIVVLKADGTIETEVWGPGDDPEIYEYPADYFISVSLVLVRESQG